MLLFKFHGEENNNSMSEYHKKAVSFQKRDGFTFLIKIDLHRIIRVNEIRFFAV